MKKKIKDTLRQVYGLVLDKALLLQCYVKIHVMTFDEKIAEVEKRFANYIDTIPAESMLRHATSLQLTGLPMFATSLIGLSVNAEIVSHPTLFKTLAVGAALYACGSIIDIKVSKQL